MRPRHFVYGLLIVFGFDARAADLRFIGPDSVVTISSVQKKKAVYLKLDELPLKLPVSIRRDPETGLAILCTELTCTAVFPMDAENYRRLDTVVYVRVDRVADVLGYSVKKKKKEFQFECENACAHVRVGSAVGDHAPGFHLAARGDSLQSLSELRAAGPVVIIFIRSGDWDPLSRLLLMRLNAAQSSFDSLETHVVAIHGYGKKMSGRWQDSLKVQVPLLSDDDSAVMRGYDVFDRGTLPHPTAFVIDQDGIIRFRQNYEQIEGPLDISSIIETIKKTRK